MRPATDEYFTSIALLIATRSTCLRRSVGSVMVNERGHILSTGYNGRAAGQMHCNSALHVGVDEEQSPVVYVPPTHPFACKGAGAKTGEQLDACEAIHAEQNALLQCRDVFQIHTCYVTASPCITCTKLLLNTSCKRIVFIERYEGHHDEAMRLWLNQDERTWEMMPPAFVPIEWHPESH